LLKFSLCLLAGATLPAYMAGLPASGILWSSLVVALLVSASPQLRPVAFLLLGLGLAGLDASRRLDDRLDLDRHGERAEVSVRIDSFPEADDLALRFTARPIGRPDLPSRLRLTWYMPVAVPALGETWRLAIRLRVPHGYANPDGFDYEGWLFRDGIGATGYVEPEPHNYRIHGSDVPRLDRIRRHVDGRLARLLGNTERAAVLSAVVVGARHRISREQWERFARTGTSHLMAVSGLHIGLAGGSAFAVAWALAGLVAGRRNLRDLALIAGVAFATGYAVLSGFAVPARRALLMAAIAALAVLCRRRLPPARLLALTLMFVVVADPLAVLSPGFRLSFAAVAVLLVIAGRYVTTNPGSMSPLQCRMSVGIKQLGLLQLSLLAGLFPLVVSEFGRFSPLAPLVNVIVLPIFNLLTVPLALAGTLLDGPLESLGDRFLVLSDHGLRLALALIDIAGARPLSWADNVTADLLAALLLPMLVILLPAGWPGRRVAAIAMAAVIANRPAPPPSGCVDYHALDVGQGLSVVLQTHRHTLLFDTGPSFRSGGSAAGFAVLPFLARRGIERIDELIVSHGDLDHAGGLRDLIRAARVGNIRVGEPVPVLGRAQQACIAGDRWTWDGAEFRVLHPRRNTRWRGNNASCVLEVSVGDHRLLLTGDIESPVEKLLAHRDRLRAAAVVFVPHHGSRTSSTESLVRATRPDIALISAGFRNRWGQPAEAVTDRWRRAGARVINSADAGGISQRLCADTGPQRLRATRFARRRVWHAAPAR
jgi:competence protein ComEC